MNSKRPPSTFFQNQPPYTHFNKSFEDPTDALFCQLNEVHPVFMKPEHQENDYKSETLLDPRNGKVVDNILYDYSGGVKERNGFFQILLPSNMTKRDHIIGLRVLQAWQEYKEVNDEDVVLWRKLDKKRTRDKIRFDQFITEFSRTQKESIYAPCKRLVNLYKQLYTAKLKQLLEDYPENIALNTCAGLPHPQSCNASLMQIEDVRLVTRRGWVPVLGNFASEFQRLNSWIENYMSYYINNMESLSQDANTWHASIESDKPAHQIYIPLESLLFLLTAGSSADLPTEVPLEIADSNVENFKILNFKEPFPPRVCGWFAHKQVVEHAFEALLSRNNDTQWLHVEHYNAELQKTKEAPEIRAVNHSETDFRVYKIDEYLKKLRNTKDEDCVKTNYAVIKWDLSGKVNEQNTTHLQFFTKLKCSPSNDEYGAQLLSSHSLKLEYKPQFGAEEMTKYELIQEWFRLKLFGECKGFSNYGVCLRVAAKDFSIELEHKLLLVGIEKQLAELYQINMPKLLTGLADTVNLLTKMPTGKYLLRFNSKFSSKLLLSAPSKEITANTVFLHSLIKAEPSDLIFMTEVPHLPINDSLCSALHKHYKIVPCALRPRLPHKRTKCISKVISDEEYIQRRIKTKLELQQKMFEQRMQLAKSFRKKVKAKKDSLKQKRRDAERANEEALEKFINEF
ncbi:little elongation complex subunit 2 [Bactrocera neohumeralis]|uniref:little elongation complex subunit 2 n=1 Tax=Bactrocera neohumeralis TaxID=98809 RepID=UPI002165608C|nr:little elongation complex subunit 2 [Bactrocera neohumeralis]